MQMIAIVAALAVALAATSVNAIAVDPTICNVRYPGAYHLSCYTANETVAAVTAAKLQCFKAFQSVNSSCVNSTYIVSASQSNYGCGTYIVYDFTTTDCLNAYQNQEKTNPNCTLYASEGLGVSWNRLTANVSAPANCTEPGPCPVNSTTKAVKSGSYHLSCYAASESTTAVAAAKQQCITAFQAANASCASNFNGGLFGTNLYGCGTYIGYGFTTLDCINAYQAYEKATVSGANATTGKCSQYVALGLGVAVNRDTATPFVYNPYTC